MAVEPHPIETLPEAPPPVVGHQALEHVAAASRTAGSIGGSYQAARASPATRQARRTESACSVVRISIA